MIEFHNVSKAYKKHGVLKDISFRIDNNDYCLLVGKNGSGKTTTINLILGLLKLNKTDNGNIEKDFKSISYFPEKFVLPSLIKSYDFINTYLNDVGNNTINTYLEKYKVPNKRICNMSKGMAQKLVLIKVLLDDSDLYIFDEPLNGLDEDSKNIFLSDLKCLKEAGKAILVCTHDPDLFFSYANKIFRIEDGKLV